MPKKGGKGKQPQPQPGAKKQAKSEAAPEALPQVWLPDQPEVSLSPVAEGTPTEKEQQEVAMLWAMEETTTPRRWDEEKELDYSQMSRKREEELASKTGNPDLFRYAQSSEYTVRYLGQLNNLYRQSDSQTDTLETIDTAQKQGRLPWVTAEKDQRVLLISKYGIKVTDTKKQRVHSRHALHFIANITYYEDTYGKPMLAVKVGRPDANTFDLHIYECNDETQAKDVCLTLAQAFEAVFNKMQMEQNLHGSDLR